VSPNSHVAIAAGAQNGFNFGEVALAGIGGAVSAGIPDVFGGLDGAITTNISGTAGQFAENFANGAIGSIVTQGIGVATGLQNNFNWAGVATAGVEQGIGAQGGVGGKVEAWLAGAATNSLLTGMNFGQSLVQEAPNTVAQIGGEALATGAEDALSGVQQLLSAPPPPGGFSGGEGLVGSLEAVWKIVGGFRLTASYDSSSGCGQSRAVAGWPRSPRRPSAIRRI
jgi:hypothetical protein